MRAFTLIEIMVVLAVFVIVGGFTLLTSMDSYFGSTFRSDRDQFIVLLQRARALSMSNVCTGSLCSDGLPHGVHIQNDAYILFQGSAYNTADAQNIRFDASPVFTRGWGDIIFTQLSGTTTATTTTLSDGSGKVSDITVSAEGQISWTH